MVPVPRFLSALVLVCCLTAIAPSASVAATPQSRFRILYHEELQRWSLESVPGAAPAAEQSRGAKRLAFEAFGRSFDLSLERNERLLQRLDTVRRARFRELELYRGSLSGQAGTWVRVGILRGRPYALIWDGTELFAIEPAAGLRDALATAAPDDSAVLIFRLRDVVGSFHDVVLRAQNTRPNGYDALVEELREAAERTTTKRVDVGIVADVEYFEETGTEEDLLVRMNIVDGIFSEQVGVQIAVSDVETYTREPDPFAGTGAEQLLNSLSEHRLATPSQVAAGLTHLFTGRDLAGDTIGIAFLGSVCDPEFGAGLTQATSGIFFDALTAAHEMGHNFGAPHDGEGGSECEGTPRTFLMSPEQNGSDQFSQCSLEQMAPVIASANCLGSVIGTDVSTSLVTPASVLLGGMYSVTVTVGNTGPVSVHDAELVFHTTAGSVFRDMRPLSGQWEDCTSDNHEVRCTVGQLANGETKQLDITLEAVELGGQSIRSTVSSGLDTNSGNNSVAHDVNIAPGAALLMALESGPPFLGPGGAVDMEVSLHNETNRAATGVEVDLSVPGLEMLSVHSASATCVATVFDYSKYTCDVGTMQSGADVQIDLTVKAPAEPLDPTSPVTATFEAAARANEPLSRIESSSASTDLTVYPAASDLAVSLVSAPDHVKPSQRVHVVVALENLGPDPLRTPGTFSVSLNAATPVGDVTSTSPGCFNDDVDRVTCTVDELAVGETRTVEVDTTAPDGTETIYGGAGVFFDGAFDTFAANNQAQFVIDVSDDPPPSGGGNGGGGGGGASVDLLLLALLAVRRRGVSNSDCKPRQSGIS